MEVHELEAAREHLWQRANNILDEQGSIEEDEDGDMCVVEAGPISLIRDSDKSLRGFIEDVDPSDGSGMTMRVAFDSAGKIESAGIEVVGPKGGHFDREIKSKRLGGFLVQFLDAIETEITAVQ